MRWVCRLLELLDYTPAGEVQSLLLPLLRSLFRGERPTPGTGCAGSFRLLLLDRFTLPSTGHCQNYTQAAKADPKVRI